MSDVERDEGAFTRPAAPWLHAVGAKSVLASWRSNPRRWTNVVLHEELAARSASSVSVPPTIDPRIAQALGRRGITSLYSHQATAFELLSAGRHAVVATPTASGKSLCYNLPVLERIAREPEARALYIFPTKALARDQEEALRALLGETGIRSSAVTYDGDTPADARRAARESSNLLITNPDMLHAGILPHHTSWARFFASLRFVIIDELHTYRGVFGSHLANLLRRLQRVARFYGVEPTFAFASATIGNPAEHARAMLGREVTPVDDNGAPSGPRHVLLYNPPVVNAELGIRQSCIKTAVSLTTDLALARVPTIVFAQSRNHVEVMLKYLRERLAAAKLDPQTVQGYRGGYLPAERRRIEADLREGRVRVVVATNALELGIDIGGLDAVVCAGYPGSVAALWQRFGRAGRRFDPSLAVLVCSSAPLDQYFARLPHDLLSARIEQARIDPDNVEILVQHLKCAAFELPFAAGEGFGDLPADATGDALGFLVQHRVLHPTTSPAGATTYHWIADSYPANHVSLRSVGWDNFVIVDEANDRAIAEMDWRSTHTMLHEQAIYQHDGEQYQVERLDFENHKAFVRKVEADYYTDALTYTRVSVISRDDEAAMPGDVRLTVGLGEVSVVEKVVGYKKIKFHTHENLGYGEVHLPDMQMHTTALWLTFPWVSLEHLEVHFATLVDALRGLANALHLVASVGLMLDPRDLGHTLGNPSDSAELPTQDGPITAARMGADSLPETPFAAVTPPARMGAPHMGGATAPPKPPIATRTGSTNMSNAITPGLDPTIFLYDHTPGGVGLAARLFAERTTLLERARALVDVCPCPDGCPACIGPAVTIDSATPPLALAPMPATLTRKALAQRLLTTVTAPSCP